MPPRQIHPALFTRKQIEIMLIRQVFWLSRLISFLPIRQLADSGVVANKFAVQAAGSQLRG